MNYPRSDRRQGVGIFNLHRNKNNDPGVRDWIRQIQSRKDYEKKIFLRGSVGKTVVDKPKVEKGLEKSPEALPRKQFQTNFKSQYDNYINRSLQEVKQQGKENNTFDSIFGRKGSLVRTADHQYPNMLHPPPSKNGDEKLPVILLAGTHNEEKRPEPGTYDVIYGTIADKLAKKQGVSFKGDKAFSLVSATSKGIPGPGKYFDDVVLEVSNSKKAFKFGQSARKSPYEKVGGDFAPGPGAYDYSKLSRHRGIIKFNLESARVYRPIEVLPGPADYFQESDSVGKRNFSYHFGAAPRFNYKVKDEILATLGPHMKIRKAVRSANQSFRDLTPRKENEFASLRGGSIGKDARFKNNKDSFGNKSMIEPRKGGICTKAAKLMLESRDVGTSHHKDQGYLKGMIRASSAYKSTEGTSFSKDSRFRNNGLMVFM